MAKDEGKDLGYHWRRSAGIYDAPDHQGPPGNAHTTTDALGGLGGAQSVEEKASASAKEKQK